MEALGYRSLRASRYAAARMAAEAEDSKGTHSASATVAAAEVPGIRFHSGHCVRKVEAEEEMCYHCRQEGGVEEAERSEGPVRFDRPEHQLGSMAEVGRQIVCVAEEAVGAE